MKTLKNITFILLFLFVGTAFSQSIMSDVVGQRASSGERMIENKGYCHISTHKSGDEYISYWWNNNRKECIQVNVYDGGIAKVLKKYPSDCNKPAYGTKSTYHGRSHKSHQYGTPNYGITKETEDAFERGYRDGLHNKAYHNIWKLKDTPNHYRAYNKGYEKGNKERGGRTSYHSGRAGNADHEYVQDLVYQDALSSYKTLKIRGFSQVKEHKSDGKTYRVWFNKRTGQCIKTTSRDYKITSIVKSNNCSNYAD